MTEKRGWSSGDGARRREAAMAVRPDLPRYFDAVKTLPRGENEDIVAWMERLKSAATPIGDRELPPADREPGSDG